MLELPFTNNSAILERLYQHFDYLQDFPCQLEGCFISEATHFQLSVISYQLPVSH